VISVSFFSSAAFAALKPAFFTKSKRLDAPEPLAHETGNTLGSREDRGTSLPSPSGVPVPNFTNQRARNEKARQPRSVVEGTTKSLNDRGHSG
jgi:hypothetical protein